MTIIGFGQEGDDGHYEENRQRLIMCQCSRRQERNKGNFLGRVCSRFVTERLAMRLKEETQVLNAFG